jgi:hypothetical protein
MDPTQLKNFGKPYTPKISSSVVMTVFASLPKDLGFIGTPKFIAKLNSNWGHWHPRRFKAVQERNITCEEFLEGMRYSLTFYSTMLDARGQEKVSKVYPKFVDKLGVAMFKDFMPTAKDFRKCPDPWDAVRSYFLGLFEAWDRENLMHISLVEASENVLWFRGKDCAICAVYREGGYPEMSWLSCHPNLLFLRRFMRGLGGDFTLQCGVNGCEGYCDWHFYRERLLIEPPVPICRS